MINKLKIDDKLYRNVGAPFNNIFEYTVISINQKKDSVSYNLECHSCNDHDNCIIECEFVDGVLCFVEVVNHDDQDTWHYNAGQDYSKFQNTREEARIEAFKDIIKGKYAHLEKMRINLGEYENSIPEWEDKLTAERAKLK